MPELEVTLTLLALMFAAGLLAVAFAFGGIEVVAIASAESEDPEKSLVNAVRSTILRISVFYLGSVLVITFLLPYSSLDAASTAAAPSATACSRTPSGASSSEPIFTKGGMIRL